MSHETKSQQYKTHRHLNVVFTSVLLIVVIVSFIFVGFQGQQVNSLEQQLSNIKSENSNQSENITYYQQQILALQENISEYQSQIASLQDTLNQYVDKTNSEVLAHNGMNGVYLTDIEVGPSYQVGLDGWKDANVTIHNLLGACNVTLSFMGANLTYPISAGVTQKIIINHNYGLWANPSNSLFIKSVSR
jgi:cell division protein FtsB